MMRWLRCRPQDGQSLLPAVVVIVPSSPNFKLIPRIGVVAALAWRNCLTLRAYRASVSAFADVMRLGFDAPCGPQGARRE
jgi:hypothetical protein